MTDRASTKNQPYAATDQLHRAAQVAASWEVAARPTTPGPFQERVEVARKALLQLEKELAALPAAGDRPDARTIALQDLRATPRLLRSAITAVSPKPKGQEELPRVILANHVEEPRAATVCATYLQAVQGQLSGATFTAFVGALQAHDPLTILEIWNLPPYLRFCLLELILQEAQEVLHTEGVQSVHLLQTHFNSMRALANADWMSILEPLIAFDPLLRQDPTGTYPKMDFETRDVYRNRVALIARHSDCTELQVAEHVIELAREGARQTYKDPRIQQRFSHIGYYLIDKGFPKLAARVSFHPPMSVRMRVVLRANADDFYITGIELITVFFIAAALFPLLPNYTVFGRLALTFLLMIMPT